MTAELTTKRSPRLSIANTKQTQQFSALTKGYKALTMAQKTTWIVLVQTINASENRTGRHKLSAANLYTKVNTVRLSCSLPPLQSAPGTLPPAPPLPATLTVTAGETGVFTCAIIASAAYDSYVQIEAAPIAPAGFNTYSAKSFRIIGTLDSLDAGPNTIAPLYSAKYGPAPLGAEIVLRLIPMDPLGEKLPGRIVTGVVLNVAAETQLPGDLTDTDNNTELRRAA